MTMSTLQELIAQARQLDQQISQIRNNERSEAVLKVRLLMAGHGLTVPEVFGARALPAETAAVVKYADGHGNVWGGRGPRPHWLKAALNDGRSLKDFEV
jgi:DNA-binding protein H-NS